MLTRTSWPPLTLVAVCTILTLVVEGLDGSYFGVTGDARQALSFMPTAPLRLGGLTMLLAPGIHLSLSHLGINLLLLVPLALIIERKHSPRMLFTNLAIIHFLALLGLWLASFALNLEGRGFLGLSQVVIGLYAFWGLRTRQWSYFLIALSVLLAGLAQDQSGLVVGAHALGLCAGVLLFLLHRLQLRAHAKRSH